MILDCMMDSFEENLGFISKLMNRLKENTEHPAWGPIIDAIASDAKLFAATERAHYKKRLKETPIQPIWPTPPGDPVANYRDKAEGGGGGGGDDSQSAHGSVSVRDDGFAGDQNDPPPPAAPSVKAESSPRNSLPIIGHYLNPSAGGFRTSHSKVSSRKNSSTGGGSVQQSSTGPRKGLELVEVNSPVEDTILTPEPKPSRHYSRSTEDQRAEIIRMPSSTNQELVAKFEFAMNFFESRNPKYRPKIAVGIDSEFLSNRKAESELAHCFHQPGPTLSLLQLATRNSVIIARMLENIVPTGVTTTSAEYFRSALYERKKTNQFYALHDSPLLRDFIQNATIYKYVKDGKQDQAAFLKFFGRQSGGMCDAVDLFKSVSYLNPKDKNIVECLARDFQEWKKSNRTTTRSNWTSGDLSRQQLEYGALDAWCPAIIGRCAEYLKLRGGGKGSGSDPYDIIEEDDDDEDDQSPCLVQGGRRHQPVSKGKTWTTKNGVEYTRADLKEMSKEEFTKLISSILKDYQTRFLQALSTERKKLTAYRAQPLNFDFAKEAREEERKEERESVTRKSRESSKTRERIREQKSSKKKSSPRSDRHSRRQISTPRSYYSSSGTDSSAQHDDDDDDDDSRYGTSSSSGSETSSYYSNEPTPRDLRRVRQSSREKRRYRSSGGSRHTSSGGDFTPLIPPPRKPPAIRPLSQHNKSKRTSVRNDENKSVSDREDKIGGTSSVGDASLASAISHQTGGGGGYRSGGGGGSSRNERRSATEKMVVPRREVMGQDVHGALYEQCDIQLPKNNKRAARKS